MYSVIYTVENIVYMRSFAELNDAVNHAEIFDHAFVVKDGNIVFACDKRTGG